MPYSSNTQRSRSVSSESLSTLSPDWSYKDQTPILTKEVKKLFTAESNTKGSVDLRELTKKSNIYDSDLENIELPDTSSKNSAGVLKLNLELYGGLRRMNCLKTVK
jgi:hypothetical protein